MSWAVETGRSHLAHFDPPLAYDHLRDRDLLSFAKAIGMSAYYVVPLVARGRTLGALAALQAESGRAFTNEDCAMLDELGQRAALALDNARLYAEAESARREAERANRAKDEFLGILGHELRNPLAPMVMALHVMRMSPGRDHGTQRQIIERQVTHLSRLVDDLLDVSRITQGKIELRRERVDLRAVVDNALELTLPVFERRDRGVDVDVGMAPVVVWGDEVRLAQVLSNLLINAAKFTPDPGAIRLRLAAEDGFARLDVSDEGVGIAPDLMPHVFDLFVQGKQAIDRGAGGLGLGLAIVKTLVHMHGGNVEAHSEGVGRGSTFTVRLPLSEHAEATLARESEVGQADSRKGRILVVDDNRDAADSLGALLEAYGFEVVVAYDGDAGIDAMSEFSPQAAILDIGLPGMDGYELAARIAQTRGPARPRLVALTGYGARHDRARALGAGFDDHLVKPVDPAHLIEVLDRVLKQKGPHAAGPLA
jgi:signal transduction histidine kinase/ActR/RegA family two-component response regulator